MTYELRASGRAPERFESLDEAEAAARRLVQGDADTAPEIIDTATGRAALPAGSKRWQDELANKVGY